MNLSFDFFGQLVPLHNQHSLTDNTVARSQAPAVRFSSQNIAWVELTFCLAEQNLDKKLSRCWKNLRDLKALVRSDVKQWKKLTFIA